MSATLREKPVAVTTVRRTLTALIEASNPLSPDDLTTPLRRTGEQEEEDVLNGLEEVNLLDGLTGKYSSTCICDYLGERTSIRVKGRLLRLKKRLSPSRLLGLENPSASKHLDSCLTIPSSHLPSLLHRRHIARLTLHYAKLSGRPFAQCRASAFACGQYSSRTSCFLRTSRSRRARRNH